MTTKTVIIISDFGSFAMFDYLVNELNNARIKAQVVQRVETDVAARDKNPSRNLPRNTGNPWTEDEDRKLLAAFDAGHSVQDIALKHERTQTGIRARLVKYGRLAA